MPTTGPLKTERGNQGAEDGIAPRFRHETEIAQAGYYAVTLDDYKIRAEMTAAPRAGILRFTFPEARAVAHSDRPGAAHWRHLHPAIRQSGGRPHHRRLDEMPAGRAAAGATAMARPTIPSISPRQFSKPLNKFGVGRRRSRPAGRANGRTSRARAIARSWRAAKVLDGCREMEGDHLGFYTEFATAEGEQVLAEGRHFVRQRRGRAGRIWSTTFPAGISSRFARRPRVLVGESACRRGRRGRHRRAARSLRHRALPCHD